MMYRGSIFNLPKPSKVSMIKLNVEYKTKIAKISSFTVSKYDSVALLSKKTDPEINPSHSSNSDFLT